MFCSTSRSAFPVVLLSCSSVSFSKSTIGFWIVGERANLSVKNYFSSDGAYHLNSSCDSSSMNSSLFGVISSGYCYGSTGGSDFAS